MLALLLATLLAFQPTTPATRPTTQAIDGWKDKVLQTAGNDVWPSVTRLAFTFNVQRNGETTSIRHDWDLTTGVDTVTLNGESTAVNVWDHDPATASEAEQAAFRRWTNDAYWLLMPLKLDDPGVHFSRPQMTEDGLVVTMSFGDGVGLTSGDQYDLRVDLKRGVIDRWTYRPNPDTAVTWNWEGYQDFNGLYLATQRVPQDGGSRISFTDIEVERR